MCNVLELDTPNCSLLREMAKPASTDGRIPVILVDSSTVVGADIFNPNLWFGYSKGIVQSCWTEYSVLHHCVRQVTKNCDEIDRHCQTHIATLQQQWAAAKFDLGRVVIYAQHPDLHMGIQAFFSGVKSLLDLLVQLLSSEKIVTVGINGFHRTTNVYGGTVLNALQNNTPTNWKALSAKVAALVSEHKTSWIDQAISARDQLVHPERGIHQLMMRLDCVEQQGGLACVQVNPPDIDSVPISQYAQRVLGQASGFASAYLALVKEAAVSNHGIAQKL